MCRLILIVTMEDGVTNVCNLTGGESLVIRQEAVASIPSGFQITVPGCRSRVEGLGEQAPRPSRETI